MANGRLTRKRLLNLYPAVFCCFVEYYSMYAFLKRLSVEMLKMLRIEYLNVKQHSNYKAINLMLRFNTCIDIIDIPISQ